MPHGKGYRTIAKDSKSKKSSPTVNKKKETSQPAPTTTSTSTLQSLPLELQQSLLNIFSYTFPHLLNPSATQEVLKPLLQKLKGHLYDRDFAAAFGNKEYLEAYAARWSPSRALGYVEALKEAIGHLKVEESAGDELNYGASNVQIICLGGGAGAEIVSLAGVHTLLHDEERHNVMRKDAQNLNFLANHEVHQDGDALPPPSSTTISMRLDFDITLVDIADWSEISTSLHAALTSPPQLSPYASEAARAAAKSLIPPSRFHTRFIQQDIISPECSIAQLISSSSSPTPHAPSPQTLVTLMFTLNELYTTYVPRTQRLLLNLTMALNPGALLLVVDSPGSYSTVTVNSSEKRYPMLWLLEHTLFTTAPITLSKLSDDGNDTGMSKLRKELESEPKPCWDKVVSEESKWFRLPEGLSYPIELENMRFQMHLYRRL